MKIEINGKTLKDVSSDAYAIQIQFYLSVHGINGTVKYISNIPVTGYPNLFREEHYMDMSIEEFNELMSRFIEERSNWK